MPTEYLELIMCREAYHCTPPELARVPLARIMMDLNMMDVEARVKNHRERPPGDVTFDEDKP